MAWSLVVSAAVLWLCCGLAVQVGAGGTAFTSHPYSLQPNHEALAYKYHRCACIRSLLHHAYISHATNFINPDQPAVGLGCVRCPFHLQGIHNREGRLWCGYSSLSGLCACFFLPWAPWEAQHTAHMTSTTECGCPLTCIVGNSQNYLVSQHLAWLGRVSL